MKIVGATDFRGLWS